MKKLLAVATALLCVSLPSRADMQTFEGHLASERDVIQIPLMLDSALQSVTIWTDSYQSGFHFDPIVALWSGGYLVSYNDDGSQGMPGQTIFDSTLHFDSLLSGAYVLTISKYANFPRGAMLSDGFWNDDPLVGASPIPNCPSPTDCEGGYFRLHIQDGVIPAPVPEPQVWQMLLAGMLFISRLYPAARGCRRRP